MIELSIIVAITVRFLHECTREGMVFGFVGFWLYDLPVYIKKPLFDCSTCMCPWWGALIVFVLKVAGYEPVTNIMLIVFCLFMAGGINAIINGLQAGIERKCNCSKSKFNIEE